MSEEKNITKTSVSFEALSSLDAPVSFWKGIPFGLQHVMAMFVANLAPIFLVASAAKMDAAQSATIIQAGLLVAGLGTCLQLYGLWLIGSRLPMVTGISFTYVAAAMSIAQNQGYGAVAGAVVLGGLLEVVLGLTAKYWRRFVPPIVSAIVVTSIGFSLLSVGATSFGGGSGAKDFGSWQNLTLGLISLVACLAFQLLMKGTAKQLSVLFGLVVGYVVAIVMGKVDFSGFSSLQVVSVPHFMPFQLEFDPGAIISFALLYVVSSVEVLVIPQPSPRWVSTVSPPTTISNMKPPIRPLTGGFAVFHRSMALLDPALNRILDGLSVDGVGHSRMDAVSGKLVGMG